MSDHQRGTENVVPVEGPAKNWGPSNAGLGFKTFGQTWHCRADTPRGGLFAVDAAVRDII
jgi:hypothetical protein